MLVGLLPLLFFFFLNWNWIQSNKENGDLQCYDIIETGEQWHPLPWLVRCSGGCAGDDHDSEVTVWGWRMSVLVTKKRSLSGIQDKDKTNPTTLGEIKISLFDCFSPCLDPMQALSLCCATGQTFTLGVQLFCNLKSCCCSKYNKGRISFVGTLLCACIWLLFQLYAWKMLSGVMNISYWRCQESVGHFSVDEAVCLVIHRLFFTVRFCY